MAYRPGMTSLPRLTGDRPGRLLARGREATVHELGAGRVLRRYDDARDTTRELAVMQHVARHGYRVPEVHGVLVDAEAGVTGMVLERVAGHSLLEASLAGRGTPVEVGRSLARLLDDLHRIPLAGLPVLPVLPDLPAPRPGDVVVHLDLHPANVLLAGGTLVVIDWATARTAPASLDTSMTALTLAAAAVAGIPADAGDVAGLPVPPSYVRAVLHAYLAAVLVPPEPSLRMAAALLDGVGARPPDVVRAAGHLVREVLDLST